MSDISTPSVSDVSDSDDEKGTAIDPDNEASQLQDLSRQSPGPEGMQSEKENKINVSDRSADGDVDMSARKVLVESKLVVSPRSEIKKNSVEEKNHNDPYVNDELPRKKEAASNSITTVYGDIRQIGQVAS